MIELNTQNHVKDDVKYNVWNNASDNVWDNFWLDVLNNVSNNVWDNVLKNVEVNVTHNVLKDLENHTKLTYFSEKWNITDVRKLFRNIILYFDPSFFFFGVILEIVNLVICYNLYAKMNYSFITCVICFVCIEILIFMCLRRECTDLLKNSKTKE